MRLQLVLARTLPEFSHFDDLIDVEYVPQGDPLTQIVTGLEQLVMLTRLTSATGTPGPMGRPWRPD
jgi:hypothetical protein